MLERGPIYKLVARHTGKALSATGTANDSRAKQNDYTGQTNQKWIVTSLGNGQYKLTGLGSGRALKPWGNLATAGIVMQLWDYLSTSAHWTIAATDSGYYKIVNVNNGKVLEVAAGSTAEGATVDQGTWTGADSQQWSIELP